MKKSEIKNMSTGDLITALVLADRTATLEVNSKRGLTKKTDRENQMIMLELLERGLISQENIDMINN